MKTKNKLTYVILILSLGALVYPFIWMMLTAFKPDSDLYVYPPLFLPRTWHFENFTRVFELIPFARYYMNNAFVTAIGVVCQVGISILAAYPLARLRFPLKNAIFTFVLLTMLMPFVVTMIPTFMIVAEFRWVDTYKGIIIPLLFNGFSIIFLRQFFLAIPKDLEDSAKLDGCSYLRILINVIIPNTKEGISTITLFAFLTWWRQYLWPLIVINSTKIRTLPIGLKYLLSDGGKEYNILMAASVMAIIPVIIVYMILEKQFIKSITFTGIKG
ncbi:MAG: carbohydrate ABC transporter permease [Spirochaetales bacterium]|jgi:multiple sugar transport system permease protein|nr:carbohydrate ABC transporter permease [Spirochaetales bacterium]